MNAQQILDLISPIPTDKFTTYFFIEDDKHCIAGHVINHLNPNLKLQTNGEYWNSVNNNTSAIPILWNRKIGGYSLVDTNNRLSTIFPQENPKDRCIAWLNMAIKEDNNTKVVLQSGENINYPSFLRIRTTITPE